MRTLTIQINNREALKKLKTMEMQRHISILKDNDADTPALPGEALSITAFRDWIRDAEHAQTIPIDDVRTRWEQKRKQLNKLIS